MELYLALDILRGRLARAPSTLADPLRAMEWLEEEGATAFHVVDLDRALNTGTDNLALTLRILEQSKVPIQVGGNIDDESWTRSVADAGAQRIVFATESALEPAALDRLVAASGSAQPALALEVQSDLIYLRRRDERSDIPIRAFVDAAQAAGIRTFVYRDVGRDGSLKGARFASALPLLSLGIAMVYAGGVDSLDDIRAARDHGFHGVVVGRAVHSGRFSVTEALACSR